jgi:hypothetical protein
MVVNLRTQFVMLAMPKVSENSYADAASYASVSRHGREPLENQNGFGYIISYLLMTAYATALVLSCTCFALKFTGELEAESDSDAMMYSNTALP